jgi:predicted ABC-type sugar transport system permease subunit
MNRLIGNGSVFDLVLGVIIAELVVLICYRLLRRRHLVATDVYANLLAAAGLLGAVHAFLAAAWWGYVAALLIGALLSHLTGLRLRWGSHLPQHGTTRYDSVASQAQFFGGR